MSESRALARQAWMIATGRMRQRRRREDADLLVVFVHGFLAAGSVLDALRDRVHDDVACDTHSFTYGPLHGIESAAARLRAQVDATRNGRRIAFVGHSLGGLVARWHLDVDGGDAVGLVTLATPHEGTRVANRYPGSFARSLRPGSEAIRRLGPESSVRHVAIAAERDTTIVPTSSAAPAGAEVHWIEGIGHNGLLFDVRAHDLVVAALRSFG